MEHCKPVSTPMESGKKFYELSGDEDPVNIQEYIGCLTYATRPDLASVDQIDCEVFPLPFDILLSPAV
jgi:hypothetical protein